MIRIGGTGKAEDMVLVARDLWFRYPGSSSWILRGVNLDVSPGRVVLIVGSSGSGKTTLLRALTGVGIWVYGGEMRGEVYLAGRRLEELSLGELRKHIQVVNQNPYTHFIEYVVGEDLRSSASAIHGKLGEKVLRKIVVALKLEDLLNKRFFELSGGQLRRVAIAKALLWDPKVIIMDEPLMWLDDEGVEEVKEILSIARSLGKALIVFEHRFIGILHLASKVFTLKNGTLVPIDHEELRHPRVVRDLNQYILHEEIHGDGNSSRESELLVVKHAWFSYEKSSEWVLRDVSLVVKDSDMVVIYGPNGSGKSTLLKILSGYLSPKKGEILKRSRTIYLPQNIYLFFTEESLEKEFREVCSSLGKGEECVERGVKTLRSLGVNVDLKESPFNLSWGQAIRASISIATCGENDVVLLMDEPFTGLTYAERLFLAQVLRKVKAPKIVTVSNKETLSLVPQARIYELRSGYLREIKVSVDLDIIALAERCRQLGLYGAP